MKVISGIYVALVTSIMNTLNILVTKSLYPDSVIVPGSLDMIMSRYKTNTPMNPWQKYYAFLT